MQLLNDRQIIELCRDVPAPMIDPFVETSVRETHGRKRVSYGVSTYGYDISLGNSPLLIYPASDEELDVKNPETLQGAYELHFEVEKDQSFFRLPPLTKALGVSVERFQMPPDVRAIAFGKSTYARVGLNVLITPLEAGWVGYLTIEIFNLERRPVRVYCGEGISQLEFVRGEMPNAGYAQRSGKYQDQPAKPVIARA